MIGFGSSKDNEVDQNENETASPPLTIRRILQKGKLSHHDHNIIVKMLLLSLGIIIVIIIIRESLLR